MDKIIDLQKTPTGGRVLCGRRGHNACCPIIEKDEEGNVIITDDYNGKVKMTVEEASLIAIALEQMCK